MYVINVLDKERNLARNQQLAQHVKAEVQYGQAKVFLQFNRLALNAQDQEKIYLIHVNHVVDLSLIHI